MSNTTLALITGANKGIGFETARRLGQRGIHIIIGARDKARGEEAAQKLAALDVQTTFVDLDVTDEMSIARAAQSLAEAFGRLDILIRKCIGSNANRNWWPCAKEQKRFRVSDNPRTRLRSPFPLPRCSYKSMSTRWNCMW